jgi:hypothetical protein
MQMDDADAEMPSAVAWRGFMLRRANGGSRV